MRRRAAAPISGSETRVYAFGSRRPSLEMMAGGAISTFSKRLRFGVSATTSNESRE